MTNKSKSLGEKHLQKLQLDRIRLDGNTQTRVARNEAVEAEYAERMKAGDTFPPLLVYFDREEYWLVDGFQRLAAAASAGLLELACEIRDGTLQDAQWDCLRSNATHGLRRSREDIAHAIELALRHNYAKSDGHIAEHVGVSRPTVTRHRNKLESTGALHQLEERMGKDGKVRRHPRRNAKGAAAFGSEALEGDFTDAELPPLEPGEAYKAPGVSEIGEYEVDAEIVPSPNSPDHWYVAVIGGGIELFNMRGARAETIARRLAHYKFRRTGPWLSRPAPAEKPEWVPSEPERWAAEHHNSEFYMQHGRFPDVQNEDEWPDKLDWDAVRAELIAKRDAELAAQAGS